MKYSLKIVSLSLTVMMICSHLLAQTGPISVKQAVTQPQIAPDYRVAYGPNPFQFGDLRLPASSTAKRYPVAIIIHGGCWQNRFGLHLMDAMAQALTDNGIATWNIEFRRFGHQSGGWPGTFQDILMATSYLGNLSTRFALDIDRIIVIGHSSGGHLALWLAKQWFSNSPKVELNPTNFDLKAVVALAPVTDLVEIAERSNLGCHSSVEDFMGGSPTQYPLRYQQVSPYQFDKMDLPQLLISGDSDPIIPVAHVDRYYVLAKKRGDTIRHIKLANAGHFEMISPASKVWPDILEAIKLLGSGVNSLH